MPRTRLDLRPRALGPRLEVPWRDGAIPRRYLPDFIVRLDDGRGLDDPLHLVVEIKGQKDATTQIKAETMRTQWVPGVNNLKTFGRWAFVEFTDVFAIEEDYKRLIASFQCGAAAKSAA